DHDGLPNLIEYAMGTNPRTIDPPAKLPAFSAIPDADGLCARLSFTRRVNDPFASLIIQESADLAGWHTLPLSRYMMGPPEIAGPGLERITVQSGGPLATIRFRRLAATKRTDHDRDGMPDDFEQTIADANLTDDIYGPEDVLPGGDFDGDGTSNAAEFLFGMDPTLPGEADHLPQFRDIETNGRIESRFVFRIRCGIAPSTYAVERSDDGAIWKPCDHLPLLAGPPQPLDDGTEEFVFNAIEPASGGQTVQFRLVILPAE
ncbi:MAG: hypothetical protein NTV46_00005, partial [Verrucomicrobia bacterium]|nr:hypothetical protein [Verrucomicrobiota bacterium]